MYLSTRNRLIDESVPKGVTVSATEDLWVPLFKNREINYFPLALDSVDYVVIKSYGKDAKGLTFQGFVSFLGGDNASNADGILRERMRTLNFDVNNPVLIGNVAIIKKKK